MKKIQIYQLLERFYGKLDLVKKLESLALKEISKRKIKKSLDVGTGFGRFANKLVKKGIKVHGIEIDKERIDYVSNLNKKSNLIVESKDATKIDFKEEFDSAYCSSLCQIGKYKKVIKGVYRALKPDGFFFIDVYIENKDNKSKKDFKKVHKEITKNLSNEDKTQFDIALEKDTSTFNFIFKKSEEWEKILISAGFEIEKKIHYYPRHILLIVKKKKT